MAHEKMASDLKGKDGASDIVQDAKVKAFISIQAFKGEDPDEFVRWLRVILSNAAFDRRDYYQADKRDHRREQPIQSIADDSQNANLRGDTPTPSEFMSRKEDRERIEIAVLELPEEERKIIELRYQQYYSISQIADMLGLTYDAAEYRWYKAVQAIRDKVRPEHESVNVARSR